GGLVLREHFSIDPVQTRDSFSSPPRSTSQDAAHRPPSTQDNERKTLVMNLPPTMRALEQTSLKGPRDIRLSRETRVPVPRQGQVLIRVAAAGVNFADVSMSH